MKTPLVSIVIPFYNCPYVTQAVDSALSQTCDDREVIVVDDGSIQHIDLIKRYGRRVKVVTKVNGGTASALNAGIRSARGVYFAWLSSDDVFRPEKIERQLHVLESNRAYISHTAYQTIDEASEPIGQPICMTYSDKRQFYETLLQGCPINGSSVMMRMEVLRTAGLFDEALRYTHDYDMWLRLLPRYDFHYLEEPLLLYRSHANMGTRLHAEHIVPEIASVQARHKESIQNLIRERVF